MVYGTAVQQGNTIVIIQPSGGMGTTVKGTLISYVNGHLTYLNEYGCRSERYIGI